MDNLDICVAVFSDHMPVLFDICFPCLDKARAPARLCRVFNLVLHIGTEELTTQFHSTSVLTLGVVAPLKTRCPKPNTLISCLASWYSLGLL